MPLRFGLLALGLCLAWAGSLCSCARRSVTANGAAIAPSLNAEWVGYKDGCNLYRYEYYGYHPLARCGESMAAAQSQVVESLFEYAGCRGYRYQYYGWRPGWQHFVQCGQALQSSLPGPNRLDRGIRPVATVADCRALMFEHYGWHHYLDCAQGGLSTADQATAEVEPIFSFQDCDAYRYEYYGWHYVVRCNPQRRWPAMRGTKLTESVQTVGTLGDCTAHRFEYFGWHDFTRCQNQPVSTVISRLSNCAGAGIPAGPITIFPGGPSGCASAEETVVTVGEIPWPTAPPAYY